jgi:hypothetical protein
MNSSSVHQAMPPRISIAAALPVRRR